MILTCPHCTVRLQMEMEHLSAQPITVRCPKCQQVLCLVPVPYQPPAGQPQPSASPETDAGKKDAATAQANASAPPADSGVGAMTDAVQSLAAMLAQAMNRPAASRHEPPEQHRCMLACLSLEAERARVQAALRGQEYDLIVAESTEHAIERLQHSRLVDVLLLDESFEAEQNGTTTIMRYVNSFHLGRRRRLYVVLVSPRYRTLDTQTAFSLGVNLLVNSADLPELPLILKKSIREFNLLYRAFNEASGVNPF